jgi:hypothetical protein
MEQKLFWHFRQTEEVIAILLLNRSLMPFTLSLSKGTPNMASTELGY